MSSYTSSSTKHILCRSDEIKTELNWDECVTMSKTVRRAVFWVLQCHQHSKEINQVSQRVTPHKSQSRWCSMENIVHSSVIIFIFSHSNGWKKSSSHESHFVIDIWSRYLECCAFSLYFTPKRSSLTRRKQKSTHHRHHLRLTLRLPRSWLVLLLTQNSITSSVTAHRTHSPSHHTCVMSNSSKNIVMIMASLHISLYLASFVWSHPKKYIVNETELELERELCDKFISRGIYSLSRVWPKTEQHISSRRVIVSARVRCRCWSFWTMRIESFFPNIAFRNWR